LEQILAKIPRIRAANFGEKDFLQLIPLRRDARYPAKTVVGQAA
jgi:hypothetical protein